MSINSLKQKIVLTCTVATLFAPSSSAVETSLPAVSEPIDEVVRESTMPPSYKEEIQPEMAAKYQFSKDGEFTKASGLPTYEWMPVETPRAIVVGIHGLTLHGRRYRVLARLLATNGIGVVTMDMRGFGRCKFDDKSRFSTREDDKKKIHHDKSYQDIEKLLTAVDAKYPNRPIIVMGESLGCTFVVRAAAEHKDLVDGIILSAPAVKLNPKMVVSGTNVTQGVKATVSPHHMVSLKSFMHHLVSPRPDVVAEMMDDPHILKSLPLVSLLSTDEFVGKTKDWGKGVGDALPILILQGSIDNCVSAKHVTDLTNAMPSDDQTIAWRGNYGHLQLETIYLRASIVKAVLNWLHDHSIESQQRLLKAEQGINAVGGKLIE